MGSTDVFTFQQQQAIILQSHVSIPKGQPTQNAMQIYLTLRNTGSFERQTQFQKYSDLKLGPSF